MSAQMCPHGEALLPAPGDLVHLDFRPKPGADTLSGHECSLKLVQWNIERGYKLDDVIDQLRQTDADVISLQEIDISCERSGWQDTGRQIAKVLQMQYVFLCEFEESHSPLRDAKSQGGGVHGNAILSRYTISDARTVNHSIHPIDWNATHTRGPASREPRRGQRAVLSCTIDTPQGQLVVYCAHFEVFCGMLARVTQLSDIFKDSRHQLREGRCHQAILGDLNTMAHGVARLSPDYCCDKMRLRSIGSSEAEWWDRNVLSQMDATSETAIDQMHTRTTKRSNSFNTRLADLGLNGDVATNALNPGFTDPFDVSADMTLDNPKYKVFGWSLMTGKLDWMLLRRLKVHAKDMGNHDYRASDHKWLSTTVTFA